jgi:hypothetical protein
MKTTFIAAAAILATTVAQAALVQGTPSSGGPANPTPLFGTLVSFDDVATGSALVANHYAGVGIASIANTLGPSLGYYASSQSGINYVGTGPSTGWAADILVEFSSLQAAVGIGIAGPTTLTFQMLDASMNLLEGYSLSTTPSNTYYYINRLANDTKYLRVAGNFVAIDDLQFDTKTVVSVPEPETYALLLAGLGIVGYMARRRRTRAANSSDGFPKPSAGNSSVIESRLDV